MTVVISDMKAGRIDCKPEHPVAILRGDSGLISSITAIQSFDIQANHILYIAGVPNWSLIVINGIDRHGSMYCTGSSNAVFSICGDSVQQWHLSHWLSQMATSRPGRPLSEDNRCDSALRLLPRC